MWCWDTHLYLIPNRNKMLGCFWVSVPCYLLELFDAVIALKINSWNICSALLSSSNANTTQSQNGVPLFTAQTGCLILSQLDPFTNKLFFWIASLIFEEPTIYYIIIFFFSPLIFLRILLWGQKFCHALHPGRDKAQSQGHLLNSFSQNSVHQK